MVLKPGKEHLAYEIFEKWELDVAKVGVTTDTGRLVLKHKRKTVCDIPIAPLADDAPNLDRAFTIPGKPTEVDISTVEEPENYNKTMLQLISCPDIASKRWIWEQYDRHVMADTMDSSQSGGGAAVVRIHGTQKAVAITTDVTPRYCYADPVEGGRQCVMETWRNLTCVGADPIAITDCLNFGNPERPEIMGQLVGCIQGMNEACKALNYPVVSGNVSLYNETNGVAIPPTPAVGGVGLIPDTSVMTSLSTAKEGDVLLLVGDMTGWLGASLYLREIEGREVGAPPPINFADEIRNGDYVRKLIRLRRVNAVHDCSDGGLALAAAELCLSSNIGAALTHIYPHIPLHAYMFGEDQGRYLLAVEPNSANPILSTASGLDIPVQKVGTVGGQHFNIANTVDISLDKLRTAHEDWLPQYMAGDPV